MNRSSDEDFAVFVADRVHALLKAAYALTGDQHAAEDLVQGALAKAFTRWHRIGEEPEPYVRRIIYHDFVSIWRSRRRRSEVSMAELPDRPDPWRADEQIDVRLMLRQALDSLPRRQRAVIILRYLEDMSLDETAAVLGCGTGTVASQTSRALAKMREAIPGLRSTLEPIDAVAPQHRRGTQVTGGRS